MRKLSLYVLFILTVSFLSVNCHKEVTKDSTDQKLADPNKIPPGQAEINGEIVEILPIQRMQNDKDPCSKAPCMAKVKVENISYGAGFPVINKKDTLTIKFNFTLLPTTKEMFPNMDETYPGLNVGDRFSAHTSFVSSIGSGQSEFFVYGYSRK